jgi:hypothetical protein
MERADWGQALFWGFGLAEGGGIVIGATYSTPIIVAMLGFLLVILPFAVGYLVARFGLAYGLVLGIAPAILAISGLPTQFLGVSPLTGALVLFFAYVLLSGLSGFAGQRTALWRHAS